MREVIECHPDGKTALHEDPSVQERKTLALNTVRLHSISGRAFTREIVGTLARTLPVDRAAKLFGVSETTVRQSVVSMHRDEQLDRSKRGILQTLDMPPDLTREKISIAEVQVTQQWFYELNPSRSGAPR